MSIKEKRGISPVVATILLVVLAIILALIIWLWARSFISENVMKNNEVVANSCDKVIWDADIVNNLLTVENKGDIALYGVVVRKVGAGTEQTCYPFEKITQPSISPGANSAAALDENCPDLTSGDVIIIPVILGATDSGARRFYTCDEKFGKEKTYTVPA